MLAYARAILHWHRRHRFCGACGSRTEANTAGICASAPTRPACSQHFPRTDPVVIMLVTRTDPESGRFCLSARPAAAMDAGTGVTLAGFVEPGETLEEAVRREVLEESSLIVGAVRYKTSQPWPFPGSLMLGFRAEAGDGPLAVDHDELEDARWFRREDVARIRTLGLRLPFRGTIARALIEGWLAEGTPAEGKGGERCCSRRSCGSGREALPMPRRLPASTSSPGVRLTPA